MKVGSYIVLNDVIVLAHPGKGTRKYAKKWWSGDTVIKKIVRASRVVQFSCVRCVVEGRAHPTPSERDLAPKLLFVLGPSNRSSRSRSRDH